MFDFTISAFCLSCWTSHDLGLINTPPVRAPATLVACAALGDRAPSFHLAAVAELLRRRGGALAAVEPHRRGDCLGYKLEVQRGE